MNRDLSKIGFDELYAKWIGAVGDPDKNIVVSKNTNAMAWRLGFFYLARIVVIDVRKIPPPPANSKNLIRAFDYKNLLEITLNTILN